jgi:hypothetical protein
LAKTGHISTDNNRDIINSNNNLSKNKDIPLQKELALWAIGENITQSSLKNLLEILRHENDLTSFHNLPKDPRTMLFTLLCPVMAMDNH